MFRDRSDHRLRKNCIMSRMKLYWERLSEQRGVKYNLLQFSSIQLLNRVRLFVTHESQHARTPCPSPTPGVYSNSCPSSQWCHPAISSSVVPFSSCPQSLPAPGSFPVSQPFVTGGQSIGVSASAPVLWRVTLIYSRSNQTGDILRAGKNHNV